MSAVVVRAIACVVVAIMSMPAPADESATDAAIEVMHAFLAAFNGRDEVALADTLQFPHVRLASGRVALYPDKTSFIDAHDIDAFAERTGWQHSTWDEMEVIQESAQKVHIQVQFSRFDVHDELIATYDSLYVIEKVGGRWGVRARSSFAP